MSCLIYRIVDNTNGNQYVGSTKTKLSDRMKVHRYYVNNEGGGSSSIVMKNQNYYVEIIEECDLSIRYERERYFINNTENCINKLKLNGTCPILQKKWRDNNIDRIRINKHNKYKFQSSWGGDKRSHNNLLLIHSDLFK